MTRYPNSASLRALFAALVIALITGAVGCAEGEFRFGDPFDRQLTLSESQHRYTLYVRWNEVQKAKAFVAKDDRDAFMEQMDLLDDIRITDYESEPVELDKQKQSATIRVTYTLYTPSIPYEIEISEIQEWTRAGISNEWQVLSTFEGLRQLASN